MKVARVKGLKRYEVRDRKTGKVYEYCYHRATGTKITEPYDTAAFYARLKALDEKVKKAPEPIDGTLGGLIQSYKRSPEFAGLSPRSREDYDKVFEYLRSIWPMPLGQIDGPFVIGARDKAFEARKRRFANYLVQVLSLLWTWAKPRRKDCATNPAADVPKLARPKQMARANRPWAPAEWGAVWKHAPLQIRRVVALGTFALMRESDALAFDWEKNVLMGDNGPRGVVWHQGKTGDEVRFDPAPAQLLDELTAIRRENDERLAKLQKKPRAIVPLSIIVAAQGRGVVCLNGRGIKWTGSGFRASFRTLLKDLEAKGLVRPGLTFHGLRHTGGKMLADLGADLRTIAAALGHRSMAMAEFYSREADKDRSSRKAVTLLSDVRRERRRNGVLSKRTDKGV